MTEENKRKVKYLSGYVNALKTVARCKRTIEALNRDIDLLRMKESEPRSNNITGMPSAKNENRDLSDYAASLDRYESQISSLLLVIDRTMTEAAMEAEKIYYAISSMKTSRYKDILTDVFIGRMTFRDMADKYGYTRGGMYKVYVKALDEFELPGR